MERMTPDKVEYECSIEFEAPKRDIDQLFGEGTVTLECDGEFAELVNGEYKQCTHCGGLVEVNHLETHLEEQHNIVP